MSGGAGELLSRLGATVRPEGVAAPTRAPARVGEAGFGDLLRQAMEGTLGSGRRVEVEPASGVELSAEQIDRVSAAADRAELAGVARALVEIDGMELIVDVPMRRVLGAAEPDAHGVLAGIDGLVRLTAEPAESRADRAGVLRGGMNASLLDALARRDERGLAG